MKNFRRVITSIMCAFTLAIGTISMASVLPAISDVSVIAQAAPSTPSQIINDINGSAGGVLGTDVKKKVTGLAVDVQQIILTIVMAVLICSTAWTSIKFAGAGDDAQAKGKLKNAIIYQVLGIVFVASYWGMITFGLTNLNMFG